METDEQLEEYLTGVDSVVEIPLLENRYANFLVRKIFPTLLEVPDSKWSFYNFKTPIKDIPNLLYSRSYPLSSTLMGLKLKKQWGIPWILHLSDPWALSFQGDSPATNFGRTSRKWNVRKEKECFELAEVISFTSSKTIDLYTSQYPEYQHKFLLTPNVYDDDKLSNQPVDFSGKLKIVYTGGFGEKRNPFFFLNSIKAFLNNNEQLRDRIEFLFTGPMTRENRKKFLSFQSVKEIVHLGSISYKEMLELQRSAHILVNIDTDISDRRHSVFFPSKLLEYMAANRRILAITNDHSVTHDVIHEKSGDCVEFNDEQNILRYLSLYWSKFQANDESFFTQKNKINLYSAQKNALKLFSVFQDVLRKSIH